MAKELNIGRDVFFAGKVAPDKIPGYMAASDIFVLPSVSEGLPNVLLEAMAARLPIVATEVGGVPSIVKNGINGFLVEPKNPSQIAQSILNLLEGDETRRRMANENQREARKYDWDAVVDQLERVYFTALS